MVPCTGNTEMYVFLEKASLLGLGGCCVAGSQLQDQCRCDQPEVQCFDRTRIFVLGSGLLEAAVSQLQVPYRCDEPELLDWVSFHEHEVLPCVLHAP